MDWIGAGLKAWRVRSGVVGTTCANLAKLVRGGVEIS